MGLSAIGRAKIFDCLQAHSTDVPIAAVVRRLCHAPASAISALRFDYATEPQAAPAHYNPEAIPYAPASMPLPGQKVRSGALSPSNTGRITSASNDILQSDQ